MCWRRNWRAPGSTVCHNFFSFSYFSPDNRDGLTQPRFGLDTITGDENFDQKDVVAAESELLQSIANTQMKGKVLEATLITHPILKAVHSGVGSTARER